MLDNSFDIVDFVRKQFSDTFVNRLAMHLGESRERAQGAVNSAIPGFLSEFDNSASTPEGSRRLASAIDDTDDSILDNFSGVFGNEFPVDSNMGILRSIMGAGGLSGFAGSLGRISGLSGKSVTTLLGIMAPMMFGAIKRALRSRGLRPSDVGSFLASERTHINAALPTGMGHVFTEEVHAGPRTASRIRRAETTTEPERSSSGWVLPLLGLLAASGLIWYLATRSTRPSVPVASNMAERVPVPATDLRTRYRTVLQEAESQGVEFSSISQEGGKLVLKGTAPTVEAANRVRDEIKRVNPGEDEIVADISIQSARATLPKATLPKTETVPDKSASLYDDVTREKPTVPAKDGMDREKSTVPAQSEEYTVVRGDTLSSISNHFYGKGKDYTRIYNANKDRIHNPNSIAVGDKLMIPK